jgi:hypothetical protein
MCSLLVSAFNHNWRVDGVRAELTAMKSHDNPFSDYRVTCGLIPGEANGSMFVVLRNSWKTHILSRQIILVRLTTP